MKQVLLRKGKIVVEEVPAPTVEPGRILVRLSHSCISAGTEMGNVKESGLPLWKKAIQQPERVKKVLGMVKAEGFWKTRGMVQRKMALGHPMGYSAAGVVLDRGAGVGDLTPGDRVACAGDQFAFHSEIIQVPRNLAVPVPKNLGLAEASTVTLGSIALQGVRRAQPTLGETFVVVGLGLLGQLTLQMLKANGCRVFGVDPDASRRSLAGRLGLDRALDPESGNEVDQVFRLTGGLGADGVIITAATPSHEVVSTAFKMCRKKGRVVLVGSVGLNLNRADLYPKELDFFISTSYGPGRYDPAYEEKGRDYPAAYVRWTENRNMAEYLNLAAAGRINLKPLIHATFPVEKAAGAYESLNRGKPRPMIVLLSYPPATGLVEKKVVNPEARPSARNRIRISVVGAGEFARGTHLPHLASLSSFHLRSVVSRSGANAKATAEQFRADYSTTDFQEVLRDKETDAILIATRHHLHAGMALEALQAGKHVLVEKPLALNAGELDALTRFFEKNKKAPLLLTGFNRRFSKYAEAIQRVVKERTHPMILNYRMNAGYLPKDHWTQGEEGGGRNIGEACHIYDLFTFLTGSKVLKVEAQSLKPSGGYYGTNDNFVAVISFEDGSVGTLTYTALGSREYPKEQMEVFFDGKVVTLTDYKRLEGAGVRVPALAGKVPDKGHKEEWEAFARAIQKGGEWPIPLWQQIQAMTIAFEVEKRLARGTP